MTSLLAQHISEAVTNEHIGPGYWRLRTDDWDLPGALAAHLLAKGWREPLPVITAEDFDDASCRRILDELAYEKRQSDLEARALQCVADLERNLIKLEVLTWFGPAARNATDLMRLMHLIIVDLDRLLPAIIRGRVVGR